MSIDDEKVEIVERGMEFLTRTPELIGKEGIVIRFCLGSSNWMMPESKSANALIARMNPSGKFCSDSHAGRVSLLGTAVWFVFSQASLKLGARLKEEKEPTIIPYLPEPETDKIWTLKLPRRQRALIT